LKAVVDGATERAGQPPDVHEVIQRACSDQARRELRHQRLQLGDGSGGVAGTMEQPAERDAP